MNWQPIETAPKDSITRIDIVVKYWDSARDVFFFRRVTNTFWSDGRWLMTDDDCKPTHWMPIPELPCWEYAESIHRKKT